MRPGVQNREEERGAGGGLQELGLRGPRRGATGAPGSTAVPTRNTKEWGESARPARSEHTAVLVARLSSQLGAEPSDLSVRNYNGSVGLRTN